MKQLLITLFILLIVTNLYAKEKSHWAFKAMQFTFYVSSYADLAITSKALRSNNLIVEDNPIVRACINDPVLTFGIVTGINIACHLLSNWLYKLSKPWAWTMIVILNVTKGYVVYRGIQVLK